jgi:hypothetical protein
MAIRLWTWAPLSSTDQLLRMDPAAPFKILHFLKLTMGPNRLDCYILLGWKGLTETNTLAFLGPFVSCEDNEVL